MSNVFPFAPGGLVTREQLAALEAMDAAIVEAVKAAKECRVPQGLIVSVLHGHDIAETQKMVNQA